MTQAQGALDRPREIPLWRNINFQLMWSSIAASGFADRIIQLCAYMFLGIATGLDAAPVQAGVMFFFVVPYIFFGPIGGGIADRLPRKWIMFACDESRGLLLLFGVILIWLLTEPGYMGEPIPDGHRYETVGRVSIYGIVALSGALACIFGTCRDAMTPQVIPLRHLQAGNAVILAIASIAALIGLGVGGQILQNHGVKAVLIVAALCYLITGAFWAVINPVQHTTILEPQQQRKRRFVDVIAYVLKHKRLIQLYAISFLFWSLAYVFLAVLAALVKSPEYYATDPDQIVARFGFMQMFMGAGMLGSSVLLMLVRNIRLAPKLIHIGLMISGLLLIGIWINTSYIFGLGIACGIGFFSNFARIGSDSLTQINAANYMRGRVFGARDILTNLAAAAINLCIWQLPNADQRMIILLPFMGLVMVAFGVLGFWIVRHTGPRKPQSVATV